VAKDATEKVSEKATEVKAKVETKVATKKSATKKEPADSNETAQTAPLASQETVESHEPTTPDNPLEETRIDASDGS
jgi:hypothetical protein